MTRARLSAAGAHRMSERMRARPGFPVLFLAVAGLLAPPALAPSAAQAATAHPAKAAGPKAIGTYEDWTAAINREAGETVCYAFTRAKSSHPAISGRGDVVLTVTERPGFRDAVALSAGFAFAQNAAVKVVIDTRPPLDFYTSQRSAFSRDGHATVDAFLKSIQVVATSPGPRDEQVVDKFSLRGFNAAYAAILKACPAGKSAK